MPRLMRACVLLWALIAAFGPATTVQLAGWSGMFVRALAERPVAEAVEQTFDGRHPCCMCTTAAALRRADPPTGRAPVPDSKKQPVHLMSAEPMAWAASRSADDTELPRWEALPARPGVEPVPDDPVPRRRS
ncbi:MAG: hypothetical protein J0M02_06045 [Planctomycetes bacterium]|nr:hypothetical protein [Planctomycetota bacterium]